MLCYLYIKIFNRDDNKHYLYRNKRYYANVVRVTRDDFARVTQTLRFVFHVAEMYKSYVI